MRCRMQDTARASNTISLPSLQAREEIKEEESLLPLKQKLQVSGAVRSGAGSSGSSVIPRRARPGLAGLRPHSLGELS